MGHPSEFQRVSRLGFITAATSLNGSQPNFARCLAVSWAGTLYVHFRELLPRYGILPGARFTLCPSLALSSIGSVTARHSSTGRQPNCGVEQRAPPMFTRAAITLGIGPHCSFFMNQSNNFGITYFFDTSPNYELRQCAKGQFNAITLKGTHFTITLNRGE